MCKELVWVELQGKPAQLAIVIDNEHFCVCRLSLLFKMWGSVIEPWCAWCTTLPLSLSGNIGVGNGVLCSVSRMHQHLAHWS